MSQARIDALERELAALREQLAPRAAGGALLSRVLGHPIVLESLPELVCVLDRSLNILYLNRPVSGYNLPDLIGSCVLDYLPADQHARYRETFEAAWARGEPQYLEFESLRYCWQSRFVPLREADQVVLMLVASLDTTERVAAQRALSESDSRLRHASDVAGMGTWTHDWESDVIVWDDALREIYDIQPDEVPPGYEQFLARVHPEDRQRVHASFMRARASGVYEELEHRILRPSGEVRHVLAKGRTTYDKQGNAIGSLGAAFDITARKRLEEQLNQVQKMEAIGELTAGIAHNFNNVLSIILPNVALCKREAAPQQYARLADIEHAAERAADLVRQLMLFARREVEVKKSPLDPILTVQRTLEICRTTFDRGIDFQLEVGAEVPRVNANAGQLEQVLLNICLNARDALEDGDVRAPSIAIRVERSAGGDLRIRVSDNGPGMDEQTRSRVFEPFFTTKAVGRGTGLGLASAYAIVNDHGGRIRCESRSGEGSTFEILLPGLPPLEAAAQVGQPTAELPRGTETVFVVDDEPLVRRATRAMLEQGGYRVLDCGDGEEALWIFERQLDRIQLVILDRSMPGLSGEDVFTRLQELASHVPIVLLSGQPAVSSTAERAAASLSKPVDLSTLLRTVRRALDTAQGARRPSE
ncbi:MAG TPA: ATP-binding protein [Polyangiales bacterium]|nr:ATP-binding protein [Polyangiales bacterium]